MSGVSAWPVTRLALWTWLAVMGAVVALSPLTESQRFLVVGGLAAALVLAVGVALRLLRVPWYAVTLVQVAVLVLWGTVTFASTEATLGFLPNGDVLATWRAMVQSTLEHSQTYPAPVPRLVAFESTIAWAVGGVAIIADLLVSGVRRAPLVGLLFLALYMAPVSILSGDVSIVAFVPGALGYVFLLVAAQRDESSRWGRDLDEVGGSADETGRGKALTAVGQKAGLGAIACAVVVPLVIPTLPPTYFGTGGTGGDGTGPVNIGDPTQDLKRNLGTQSTEELVRMTSTGEAPSYVRLATLTELDREGWAPGTRRTADQSSVNAVLPSPPGQSAEVSTREVSYQVRVSDRLETRWLPATYAPTSIEVDGAWRYDNKNGDITVRGRRGAQSDFPYSFSASLPEPTRDQLRVAPDAGPTLEDRTELPDDVPDVIAQRAREVTRGEDTDFDKALAIQRWFRADGGFEYDVRTQAGSTYGTLRDFLTDDRRGYCEQFAGAMAAMARAEGIPARVAVGFLRPERDGDTYVFRGTDMHAWPELYFENIGWVQFEPTPGGDNYAAPQFAASTATQGPTAEATESGGSTAPTQQQTRETAGPQLDDPTSGGGSGWPRALGVTAAVVVGIGLLSLLPLAGATLFARRRRRAATTAAERAELSWRDLQDRARDLGLGWDRTLTPRGLGRSLAHRLPPGADARDALDRVVAGVERARYARDYEGSDLRPDVRVVVRALASGRSRTRRWRARWLPLAWSRSLAPGRERRGGGVRGGLLDLREQE